MSKLCYVTAFLDIGRGDWGKFNRSFDAYLNAFLPYVDMFKNEPEIDDYEMIVYIDEIHYETIRGVIPEELPIQVIKINEQYLYDNMPMWKRLDRERDIMESEEYKTLMSHRLQYPEHNNPKYTMINHIKVDFIAHAMGLTDSEYLCWSDFGYFQCKERIPKRLLDIEKFDKNRVNYTLITPIIDEDKDIYNILKNAPERIGGFFFSGNRDSLLQYQQLYHEIHEWFQNNNIADDDQHLALQCYFERPDIFNFHMLGQWHQALIHFQKRPKVAVCISGFIRTWEHTKKSFLEQLCQNADIDVFIHTYKQNYYEFTSGKKDVILSDEELISLFDGINVKSLVIEDRDKMLPIVTERAMKYKDVSNFGLSQKESSDPNSISIPIGVRTYDHLRKLHMCNESRKEYEHRQNIKYNLVVKTRFDIVYFNTPNWDGLCDNKFHFGYGATWGWPEDTLCVTSPHLMDTAYANRFTKFDEIFLNGEKCGICSHGTLKYMIDKYKVPIGEAAVNILCFRSENSMQYNGNYKFRCDLSWLYDTIKCLDISDIKQIEQEKNRFLLF